jgi:hypothetical protein
MNPQRAYNKLQSLLEEKLAVLKQYLSLTGEMNTLMKEPDFSELRSLISSRQKTMRKIQTVDKSIAAIVGSNRKKTDRFSQNQIDMLEMFRKEFIRIMNAVSPMEQAVMLRVENESERLKAELLATRKSRHAVTSYGPRPTIASRYLDTKK